MYYGTHCAGIALRQAPQVERHGASKLTGALRIQIRVAQEGRYRGYRNFCQKSYHIFYVMGPSIRPYQMVLTPAALVVSQTSWRKLRARSRG